MTAFAMETGVDRRAVVCRQDHSQSLRPWPDFNAPSDRRRIADMVRFPCDAVLFDLDGVLVDSSACVERHWQRWAEEHELDAAAIRKIAHGRRTEDTIALVAPHLNAREEAARLAGWEATDTTGILRIEGADDLLAHLPRDAWAVVTSGTTATALARLRHVGLPTPTVLISADDVTRGKPDPEPYQLAAKRLGIPAASCVVVEDTATGIVSAKAAGMPVIGVLGTHSHPALTQADAVVNQLTDIRVTSPDDTESGQFFLTA
jgi:sugar-phosphatase